MSYLKDLLSSWFRHHGTSPNLKAIINSLENAVIIIGKDNTLQYANSYWTHLSGHLPHESQHTVFSEFIHPEDRVLWLTHLQKFYQSSETPNPVWLRLINDNDDKVYWCEIRVQRLYPNSPYPLSATIFDITPQIRSDQVKEAHYRSLKSQINRIPAMLYRSRNDLNWTMEYVSDGCNTLTGYAPKQMINNAELSYGSLIHEDDRESVWRNVQKAIQSDKCFEITYRLQHARGETIKVYEKGCAIFSESGSILAIEGIIFTLNELP
ncbi:PAS domain-containing protein [Hydrogenovibrio sp. JE_KL2]|uniref:PAS domain-containing protein n=1 Tax=Hydrogenovibrio sp. JE_KL2 TaxID=2651188 RepID=UPI00128B7F44|nr:PAS domain-containing protein [Hydrogenovibrio sp. JE_KL2]MPQ77452.1 PAS domain-containing protein [Hydrogenovibrio sp. JE_KL2]